uniref:non-specific serine/threonine protein kinase n=1 Tax=Lygus hesperus TaxID=30085 RepID=A0A0A9YNP7_LYGHE
MVDLFRKIISADFQYPPWISREALHLLSRLLESDPSRRATIEEIKHSPFYRCEKLPQLYDPVILHHPVHSTIFDDTFDAALLAVSKKEQHRSSMYTKFTQKWKGQRIFIQNGDCTPQYSPKQLNAFDLINIISGQSMNNMIMFNKNTTTTNTFTQFILRLSIDDLMLIIDCVLLETPSLQYRICYRTCCILFIWCNQKNHHITGKIEVFALISQLHMVQCKRIEGSILVFHEFYKKFRDSVKSIESTKSFDYVRDRLREWQSEHDAVLRSTLTESDFSDTDTDVLSHIFTQSLMLQAPLHPTVTDSSSGNAVVVADDTELGRAGMDPANC